MMKIKVGDYASDIHDGSLESVMKVTGHDENNHLGIWYKGTKEVGAGSIPNDRVGPGCDPDHGVHITKYTDWD